MVLILSVMLQYWVFLGTFSFQTQYVIMLWLASSDSFSSLIDKIIKYHICIFFIHPWAVELNLLSNPVHLSKDKTLWSRLLLNATWWSIGSIMVSADLIEPWNVTIGSLLLTYQALSWVHIVTYHAEVICIDNKSSVHNILLFENNWLAWYPCPSQSIHDISGKFTCVAFPHMLHDLEKTFKVSLLLWQLCFCAGSHLLNLVNIAVYTLTMYTCGLFVSITLESIAAFKHLFVQQVW